MDTSSSEKYMSYCVCLGEALRECVIEAQQVKRKAIGTDEEEFQTGYLCGFHRIVTLMQQAAEEWEIPFDELGINFNENDLI